MKQDWAVGLGQKRWTYQEAQGFRKKELILCESTEKDGLTSEIRNHKDSKDKKTQVQSMRP